MADTWDQFEASNPIAITRDDPWAAFAPSTERSGDTNTTPPPPEDPYRKAAVQERDRLLRGGARLNEGYSDRAASAFSFKLGDEASAVAQIPLEMARRGTFNPAEAYRYNKAYQELKTEQTNKNTEGLGGAAAELVGGFAGAAPWMGAPQAGKMVFPAVPNLGLPAKTMPAGVVNAFRNATTGAAMGGVYGFGEGEGLQDSAGKGAAGALVGGTVGAVAPVAYEYGVKPVARMLQMPRLNAPENVMIERVNKAVRDSGQTMEQITQKIADAHAAGNTGYTLADAIGHEGQRTLAGLNKQSGPQRDLITKTLAERNLNMPDRVVAGINQGLGVEGTAKQAQKALIEKASAEAGPYYRSAEHSGPVWNNAIQEILDTDAAKKGIAAGVRIQQQEAAGSGIPFKATDAAITGFDKAGDPIISGVPNTKTLHTLKVGLDRMIEQHTDELGHVNAEGRSLIIMKNRLLENMDALNPDYAKARELYRGPMEVRDAVKTGQDMATRGRPADTLDTFRGLNPSEQQGARIGYADKVLEPVEKSGNFPGRLREKASKGSQELEELSLYQGPRRPGEGDQLRKFLNREEEMLKGSHMALGGSSTVENLADVAAGPGGADVLGLATSVASGNPAHAAGGIWNMIKSASTGESAAQRTAIAKALLERDPDAIAQIAARLDAFEQRARGVNPWYPHIAPRITRTPKAAP